MGGSASNVLEVNGDHDWFRIELVAGQKISIAVDGITLEDSLVAIRDSTGILLGENDDINPGVVRDSRLVFTAPTTGTYYIDVGAFNNAYAGTYQLNVSVFTPPPVASYAAIAEHLTSGYWGGDSHHFNVTQGGTITVNLTQLTAAGQSLAREALALWSDVIGVAFAEVSVGGQITFDDNESGAFSDGKWSSGIITSSHVNVSTQWLSNYGTTLNSYSFQTYIHEIGHALGLGHGGFYNGSANYDNDALFANDGWPATIMSYFDQNESTYFNDLGFSVAYLTTPMLADIRAMATLYGLSTTTRTGDTTYGFGNTSGRSVYTASVGSTIAALTIFDSGGIDTLNYSGFASNQIINLNSETFSNVGGGIGNVVIAFGTVIENAIGGSGDDVIRGNSADNMLTGGGGNDTLDGLGGNDVLVGGGGADVFTGGAGDDSFRDTAAGLSGDTITDFAAGDRIVIADATLDGFTFNLSGSTLTYTGGSLALTGGISGTLVATAAVGGGVQLAIQAQSNTINGTAGNDTLSGTSAGETLNGLDGNDIINGLAGNDILNGGTGNDRLDGGAGSDTLVGATGDDIFIVDSVGDVVTELTGEGVDEVHTTLTSYTLPGNVEILRYVGSGNFTGTGGTGADTLYGNAGNDALNGLDGNDILNGGAGNDRLDGGAGSDTLAGATGDDIFIVDSVGDVVTELTGEGTDEVQTTLSSYTLPGNVEILRYVGAGNFTGTGGTGADTLYGNAGNDALNGLDGNDILNGGAGNDTLAGGAGSDTLAGGTGDDVFIVDSVGDVVTELTGEGVDEVQTTLTSYTLPGNVEILRYVGSGTFTGTGGTGADTLYGNIGADRLNGLAGNDTINGGAGSDTLTGGMGIDILTGGAGNDIFRDTAAGLSGDTITDFAVGDKILIADATWAGFTYSLSGNTLTYTGGTLTLTGGVAGTLVATAALNGGGVQLAAVVAQSDTVKGTAGDVMLTRTIANETINGLDGNRTINREAGSASFEYSITVDSTVTGREPVHNWGASDKIDFSNIGVDAGGTSGDTLFIFADAISCSDVAGQLRAFEEPVRAAKGFPEVGMDGFGITDLALVTENHPVASPDFYLF